MPSYKLRQGKQAELEMKKNLFFILMAILLLTPWPVAYAYENALAGTDMLPVEVAAAEESVAPSCNVFGNAIGGVNPGDLFYIDSAGSIADMAITLHITNADELIQYYRYMTLEVGVYVQTDVDQWQRITLGDGSTLPDSYITMRNGRVSFNLPGYAKYKVTLDGGCFYSFSSAADRGSASPSFYLTVE